MTKPSVRIKRGGATEAKKGLMTEENGDLEADGARLTWRRIRGRGPTIVWLGGFASDMTGTKAQVLADWAAQTDRDFLRFDYFGHGASSGDFREGTITRWRADALAIIDALTDGPLVLVGSSMGGWIACLAALSRADRVAAMVLIAPAPDFTEKLMRPDLPPEALDALAATGEWVRPSAYGDGYPITRALLEDGARWSILDGPIGIDVPVRILQGGGDEDVPFAHALHLATAIEGKDVTYTLIKDGDHRLSRPQDLARLIAAVEELIPSGSPPALRDRSDRRAASRVRPWRGRSRCACSRDRSAHRACRHRRIGPVDLGRRRQAHAPGGVDHDDSPGDGVRHRRL